MRLERSRLERRALLRKTVRRVMGSGRLGRIARGGPCGREAPMAENPK
jgi:hypothetical protein